MDRMAGRKWVFAIQISFQVPLVLVWANPGGDRRGLGGHPRHDERAERGSRYAYSNSGLQATPKAGHADTSPQQGARGAPTPTVSSTVTTSPEYRRLRLETEPGVPRGGSARVGILSRAFTSGSAFSKGTSRLQMQDGSAPLCQELQPILKFEVHLRMIGSCDLGRTDPDHPSTGTRQRRTLAIASLPIDTPSTIRSTDD